MANVRKDIIENRVYGDILIKLAWQKIHVNKFVNQFVYEDQGKKGNRAVPELVNYKKQSVLNRQMQVLYKEGFVKIDEDIDDKNKKLYYINLDKIITSFLDYVSSLKKNKEGRKELKDTYYRKKCCENYLIKHIFIRLISEARQVIDSPEEMKTLKEIYDIIVYSGYPKFVYGIYSYLRMEGKFDEELSFFGGLSGNIEHKIRSRIKREWLSEFEFFNDEFLEKVILGGSIKHYFDEMLPQFLGEKLVEGFDEKDFEFTFSNIEKD